MNLLFPTIDPVGLCARCVHVKVIHSDRGNLFYQCKRSCTDPAYVKYPRLPMYACRGFEASMESKNA